MYKCIHMQRMGLGGYTGGSNIVYCMHGHTLGRGGGDLLAPWRSRRKWGLLCRIEYHFYIHSDLVDGLIKLMNSNISSPVNLVSFFVFVAEFCRNYLFPNFYFPQLPAPCIQFFLSKFQAKYKIIECCLQHTLHMFIRKYTKCVRMKTILEPTFLGNVK